MHFLTPVSVLVGPACPPFEHTGFAAVTRSVTVSRMDAFSVDFPVSFREDPLRSAQWIWWRCSTGGYPHSEYRMYCMQDSALLVIYSLSVDDTSYSTIG